MKGASLFFSCLLPIIRVCTASKMAGGSGNCVCACVCVCVCFCVCVFACLLYVIMCARWVPAWVQKQCVLIVLASLSWCTSLRLRFSFHKHSYVYAWTQNSCFFFPFFASLHASFAFFSVPAFPAPLSCLVGAYQHCSHFLALAEQSRYLHFKWGIYFSDMQINGCELCIYSRLLTQQQDQPKQMHWNTEKAGEDASGLE